MDSSAREPGSPGLSRFGPFTLDAARCELRRDGVAVALRPKTYALLAHLVANPGRVATKSELLASVWPGVVVNDESLSQCINELRGAMGTDGAAMITTLPRRGYRFDAAVATSARAKAPALPVAEGPRRRWTRASVCVGIVLALGVHWEDGRTGIDQSIKARRSIAVLPFADAGMPGAKDLAGAVTEELVTDLAKLPDTQVVARPSASGVQDTDVRRVGRELGVRYVVAGSLRRDPAGMQIHVRLASPETGTVLWSESFHHDGAADSDWQRAVGLRIARSLDVRMAETARSASTGSPGRALDAVDATLHGQHLLRHVATYDDVVRARAYFEQALATEPDSAGALTGLAQTYVTETDGGWSIGLTGLRLAEQALARARTVAPDYLPARSLSARLLAARGHLEDALRVNRTVLAANPSDPWAHARIAALLMRLGRPEEVVAHCDAALQLAPGESNLVAYSHLYAGYADYYLGHDDAAYERFRLSAAAGPSPTQFAAFLWLAAIDALHGRGEEARQNAAEVLRLRPRFSVGTWRVWTAPVHPPLQASRDRFYAGLARTGLPE
jgi:DNA-binding winged helix-turn-helix (wHTH) protein/TolB-like protein/tetratricopeptide (TPR) repeat protein